MRDVLKLLYMVMTSLENFQGVSFGFGTPPPIQYTDIYFNIYFSHLTTLFGVSSANTSKGNLDESD